MEVFTPKEINDVVGNMIASDLVVTTIDTTYALDTISLTAFETSDENRKITMFSDIASLELDGEYNLETIVPATKYLLKE